MSAPRRSSSPLSSASPSPVTGPTVNGVPPPTRLDLGVPAAPTHDADGDLIGGSSPTTLTDALTESELTEDEGDDDDDDDDDDEAQDGEPQDGDDDEAADDDGDEEAPRPVSTKRNGASPSPSLTPPPPSDPPRSEALPSSPLPEGDDDPGKDEDEPMDQDEDLDAADNAPADASPANLVADGDADDADDEDEAGDLTMRADDLEVKQELIADIDNVEPGADAEAEEGATLNMEVEEGADAEPEAEADADAEVVANGGAEAAEEEEEAEAQEDSPAAQPSRSSQHVAPPTPQATRALLALEIKFAALRDRLYVERLEEAAREEEMILNGTHPALLELNKVLESRRERLHEIALRRYEESLNDLAIWRDVEKKISWSTWTDQRDQIHWEEFEHTWSKRRRLAREKNEIETPKVPKTVPRAEKPPRPFNWSAGAVPQKLSTEDALRDLQLMDVRRQQPLQHTSRHASPAMFANPHAGPSSGAYYQQQQQQQQQQQHPASYLQQAEASDADRRHHYTAPPPRQPARPQAQARPPAHALPTPASTPARTAAAPSSSAAGPSSLSVPPRKTFGSEAYGIPRREPPSSLQANGDGKLTNGHGRHLPGSNVLGLGLTPGAAASAADTKPTPAALAASSSASATNASSRFPGLADYLSGSATPPQNSFQHHLQNTSTAAGGAGPVPPTKSTPSVPSGTSAALGTAGLGRPSFAAPAPHPQAASVPRS